MKLLILISFLLACVCVQANSSCRKPHNSKQKSLNALPLTDSQRTHIISFLRLNMRFPQAEESVLLALTPLFFTGKVAYQDITRVLSKSELDFVFDAMTRVHENFNVPEVPRWMLEKAFKEDRESRPISIANVIQLMSEYRGIRLRSSKPDEIVDQFLKEPQFESLRRDLKEYSETIYDTIINDRSLQDSFRNYIYSIKFKYTKESKDRPSQLVTDPQIQTQLRNTIVERLQQKHPELKATHSPRQTLASALVKTMAVESLPAE